MRTTLLPTRAWRLSGQRAYPANWMSLVQTNLTSEVYLTGGKH